MGGHSDWRCFLTAARILAGVWSGTKRRVILALAQALHAWTFAAHHSACVQWISQAFPGPLRARGQALYSVLGYGLTGVLGALGGGVISQAWGMEVVFQLSALSAVAALFCAWRFGMMTKPGEGAC